MRTTPPKSANGFFPRKNAYRKIGVFLHFFAIICDKLVFFDRANGASVFARAAINTFVRNNVDSFVAKYDCANGTGIRARAASYAFIRNQVCHFTFTSEFLFVYPL